MTMVPVLLASLFAIPAHSFVLVPYSTYPLSPVSLLYPPYPQHNTGLLPQYNSGLLPQYNTRLLPQYNTRLIPQSPLLLNRVIQPVVQPVVQPVFSTLTPGLKFSPTRQATTNLSAEDVLPIASARLAARNLDICYFLASDIFTSHVPCNPNWGDGTNEGVKRYINELTFETNQMLGVNNLRLTWKGPYERSDPYEASPTNPTQDVLSVSGYGCDAVVFLKFNTFSSDCKTKTSGHEFAGSSVGGMCEQEQGLGYTIIVDQGFLEEAWTGPQILAHHLLLMLTSDLNDTSKTCPLIESLLHPHLYPGEQRIDQCVVEKLNRSEVSLRDCMQNK